MCQSFIINEFWCRGYIDLSSNPQFHVEDKQTISQAIKVSKTAGSRIDTIKYRTCPGDHKAAMNRHESMTKTSTQRDAGYQTRQRQDINNTNVSEKKYRLGTVSKNILLEGLNQFHGANLALYSDVGQDTFGKVKKHNKHDSQHVVTRLQRTDTTAQHTPTWIITNKNDPQKKHRLWKVSQNTLTGGLEPVSRIDTKVQHTPTWITTNKNDQQKIHRLGKVSQNTLTGGLEPVSRRQPRPYFRCGSRHIDVWFAWNTPDLSTHHLTILIPMVYIRWIQIHKQFHNRFEKVLITKVAMVVCCYFQWAPGFCRLIIFVTKYLIKYSIVCPL